MAAIVSMPKLGYSMTTGRIIAWTKKEGEKVEKGETILTIETDKVTYEIEAPESGVLAKILVNPDEVIPVGNPLGVIAQGDETIPGDLLEVPRQIRPEGPARREEKIQRSTGISTETLKASPLAKKIAKEHGIDLREVKGTGPDGRIDKADVEAFLKKRPIEREATRSAASLGPSTEQIIKLSSLRQTISKRLSESYQQVPHICLFTQVRMAEVQNILQKFSGAEGTRKSPNDFIIKATALSLERFKLLNSSLQGETIAVYSDIHIGLAVSIEDGLIVPVIRNPHKLSLSEIASLRETLVSKARGKNLKLEDLEGGTFTISNLGSYGIHFFTSIINPPQCAILSVGAIRRVPWVEQDEIKIAPVMDMSLSIDHRIVDGALGALFLEDLRKRLENPYLILAY